MFMYMSAFVCVYEMCLCVYVYEVCTCMFVCMSVFISMRCICIFVCVCLRAYMYLCFYIFLLVEMNLSG